jgi:hypothetical protein
MLNFIGWLYHQEFILSQDENNHTYSAVNKNELLAAIWNF